MFSAKDIFQTKAKSGYTIAKSLRFRSSASAYLSRTPGSAGNQQKFTWSGWVKRGALGSNAALFYAGPYVSTAFLSFRIRFQSDSLAVWNYNTSAYNLNVVSTSIYRDPSAWYHVVVAVDTTSATTTITGGSTDRVRMYVNGVQITSFSTTTVPTQNLNTQANTTNAHYIGNDGDSYYLDGYLAEVNFIDGQALDPTYFGQTDTATGVWMPKAYTGTYGTNGFYLKFADASAATAAAIGKDSSGNGNNWTPNNISVTAGVTYDSMYDTPTNYDNGVTGAGNYAVLAYNAPGTGTISDGNLKGASNTTTIYGAVSTISVDSGKWYWETTVGAINTTNNYPFIGAYRGIPNLLNGSIRPGADTGINGFSYRQNGNAYVDGTNPFTTWGTMAANDVIGVALDLTNLQVTFYKNNVSQGTITGLVAGLYTPGHTDYNGSNVVYNFGQRAFNTSNGLPPSGFKALCTQNLPTPTIGATSSTLANKYFDVSTWSGTGSPQSIANSGGFQPDLLWGKARNVASSHRLMDAVRGIGTTYYKSLYSDQTAAEAEDDVVTAFTSTGFNLAGVSNFPNATGQTYVGWQWKGANGTSNIAVNAYGSTPSIASTVSANVTAGFSVVTYTGTGANATVGHGLGVAPKMVIVKDRDLGTANWSVYHTSSGAGNYLNLNGTAANTASTVVWNNTAPTSSVFSLGAFVGSNANGDRHVAYCFAEVAGYSKFGSYTGNGAADGVFVYTGFRPRYVIIKCSSAAGTGWYIYDTARNTYNVEDLYLRPEVSDAEGTLATMDILSNGFKLRSTNTQFNGSGNTMIYAAFAETPFNYSRGR